MLPSCAIGQASWREAQSTAWVVDLSTSIDRNLNERGYGSYLVDSPLTDANYTPNPAAPDCDFRVVYESWSDLKAS